MIKTICKRPHREDCWAINAVRLRRWTTPWFFTTDYMYKDKNGQDRGGNYKWFVAKCNDPKCEAYKLVEANSIEEEIAHPMHPSKPLVGGK